MQNHEARSFKPLTISVAKLPASMAQQARQTAYAAERARLLLGCYRTGDANDPETYVAAITAVLAQYSEDIVTQVTHPTKGLPVKKSWLPTVKEVHDACEEATAPMVRQQQRERAVAELMAEREAIEAQRGQVRPTLDEMKAKYGPDWGLDLDASKRDQRPYKAPSWDDIASTYSADPSLIARLTTTDEA
jgi:hypothetical protein